MLINEDEIASLVRNAYPQGIPEVLIRLAAEITKDVEAIAYATVRDRVQQERRNSYLQQTKIS